MTVLDSKLLDLSNHDAATYDAKCLYAAGVRQAIFGTTSYDTTARMIEQALAAGIAVPSLYGFVYYGGRKAGVTDYVLRDTRNAIRLRERFGIDWYAIDSETDACDVPSLQNPFNFPRPTVGQRQREHAEARALAEAAGFKIMTYTGGYWWRAQMGNTKSQADTPLWHAQYGVAAAPIKPVTSVNYGGWTKPDIHQYTSIVPVCGRGRDHNYLFAPAPWAKGDEMTPEELKRMERLERLAGGWGIDVPQPDGTTKELKNEDALVYLDETINWSARRSLDNLSKTVTLQGQAINQLAAIVEDIEDDDSGMSTETRDAIGQKMREISKLQSELATIVDPNG